MSRTGFSFYYSTHDGFSRPDAFLIKLRETANLPQGWRFGEGRPPAKQVVAIARSLYQEFSALRLKADIFPGVDGSLSLVFYAHEISVELDIAPQGTIDLTIEEGQGFDFQELEHIEHASIADITHALLFLAGKTHQWHYSGSSTQENMGPTKNAFAASASSAPATRQAFRWLTAIASSS